MVVSQGLLAHTATFEVTSGDTTCQVTFGLGELCSVFDEKLAILQGFLAHENIPPPWHRHMALGIGLL